MRRRFEFQEGTSNKFWEVELDGTTVTTWWGKIGTAGQSKAKDFGTATKAQLEYDKLIAEKTAKGYVEAGAKLTVAHTSHHSGSAASTKKWAVLDGDRRLEFNSEEEADAYSQKLIAEAMGDYDEDEELEAQAAPMMKASAKTAKIYDREFDGGATKGGKKRKATSGKRRFEFEEDGSSKFWEIQLSGCSLTTWWGKIGTGGQSKTLPFPSEKEAEAHYNKLVIEKTKKGYEEVGEEEEEEEEEEEDREIEENDDGSNVIFEVPEEWLPYGRPAWKPLTTSSDGTPTASKFSGIPWLANGELWPACKSCHKPMQLFLQLNLASLPTEMQGKFGTGLLQLFYCTDNDCEVQEESYFGNDTAMLIRLVDPTGPASSIVKSPVAGAFPAKHITGWSKIGTEYPMLIELAELGLDVDEYIDDEIDAEFHPSEDDKLYGWPFWVQDLEYGDCKVCGGQMELVFQIASEKHLPYMFGDMGIAHISQCQKHKDQFKFGWACS